MLGESFALRATVVYKAIWVRLVRTVIRDRAAAPRAETAAEQFAQSVAQLPNERMFARFSSCW